MFYSWERNEAKIVLWGINLKGKDDAFSTVTEKVMFARLEWNQTIFGGTEEL